MTGWRPDAGPGFGWPPERAWINPSPNAANVNMARAYAGTVMVEGATLSEGRGTTRPAEIFGAPDIDARALIAELDRKRTRTNSSHKCASHMTTSAGKKKKNINASVTCLA